MLFFLSFFFFFQELLRSLETKRAENPVIELVGDIFIRLADFFRMYNMYCSNQPFSLIKFENITSRAFKSFVAVRPPFPALSPFHSLALQTQAFSHIPQECFQKPECRALAMCSFLIKPVQRICKYPLLIRVCQSCLISLLLPLFDLLFLPFHISGNSQMHGGVPQGLQES